MEPGLIKKGAQPRKLRHPYAAIEHRVIDSEAYADLSFSAQALLTLLCRQLTKDNNGQLQATFAFCSKRGFGSEHTLRSAIAELIAHGFIYRTRSHGANRAWARYAVTWLPIKRREGLYLDGYLPEAWKHWQPSEKKSSRQKLPNHSSRKCSFTRKVPAENAGTTVAESAEYELMPCSSASAQISSNLHSWIPVYLKQLSVRGLANRQCFVVPPTPSKDCFIN